MEINKEIIDEVIKSKDRDSDSFTKISFYDDIMNKINLECSNDELEALRYIFTELGRNIEYNLIPKRGEIEYYLYVRNTKNNHKNNIYFQVGKRIYLPLKGNIKSTISTDCTREESIWLEFSKKDKESINIIYKEFERLDNKYHFIDKDKLLNKIDEITGIK